ncbi:hypothetical protein [Cryobacterium cryoconiti]|uniref:Uncharacterized protein n=1 Tax=Cryobacterium cryoconiti TaxID=1259239 RepID=A0A4Y8JSP5_9MICO|nr:hypothetical protein [Cryobacterium cryoconiti]TFD27483.1 hypothetical protein E3T49_13140 [Cryobacterium cryoconiti]
MTAVTVFTCPPDHKHDQKTTCYIVHKCRCTPCRALNVGRENARRRLKAYGRYDNGLVAAGPARAHLTMLRDYGMGYKTIAAAAGVGITATRTLLYGREDYKDGVQGPRHGEVKKQILRETAARILAVKPELKWLGDRIPVDGLGTTRRLQALVAIGWSQSKLEVLLGTGTTSMGRTITSDRVWASTARAVVDLYDELWNTPPAHTAPRDRVSFQRALRYARERRWLPPMGWDDIDLDVAPPVPEPVEGIDVNAVALAVHGDHVRLSALERRAAVSELWDRNWSDSKVAEQLRITPRSVLRIRQELGLPAHDQDALIKRCAA